MASFNFTENVPYLPGAIDSAALGVDANNKLSSLDVNKFVKLAANDNYVVAADGDDIEGLLVGVEPGTVNDGFSFGSVQVRFKHLTCMHLAGEDPIAVGTEVCVGTQAAIGTAQTYPVVRAAVALDNEGEVFRWRVKSLLGNAGAAGAILLIEPLTR